LVGDGFLAGLPFFTGVALDGVETFLVGVLEVDDFLPFGGLLAIPIRFFDN